MDFKSRGNVPSCSSLGRIKNCGGSWALSKGVPDDTSEHAEKGNEVHDALKNIVLGKLPNPKTDNELLAWKLWGHIQKAAFGFYGDIELVWRAEERLWLVSEDLEPILSGQYDVLCYPADSATHGDSCIVYDCKTGWLAGDVPNARNNPQMHGLGELVADNLGKQPYGSIVREWAADAPEPIGAPWVRELALAVAAGEYETWHRVGIRTGEQCRFCPAKGNCPAYRESLSMVVAEGSVELTLETMTPENLVRILKASPMAEKVIEAANKEAHRRRLAGEELPGVGWKRGNTKREIYDEEKFAMKMLAEGIDLGEFQKTSIPVGQAYKAWLAKKEKKDNKASKDGFNKAFKDCLTFSENAPSLVVL